MSDNFTSIQAVVFDWAGTAVDFGCQGPVQAFIETFSAFGVGITAAEVREPMGMGKRDHVGALCAMPRIAAAWRSAYGTLPSEADIDRIYGHVERVMNEVVSHFSTPIHGVVEAVGEMRRLGLRIGSCTGYPRSVGEILAERARGLGYVPDILVCATDVTQGRPAPDMCREVMKRMGVTDPSRAVKIGDTVNDVLEGVHAGMWVVGVTLSGSLAGMSEDEVAGLSEAEKWMLHGRISDILTEAGAHFTVTGVAASLPVLWNIEANLRDNCKPCPSCRDYS